MGARDDTSRCGGSGTGLGEERNGAQVQVAGAWARLADSLGDGEMASPLLAALGELASLMCSSHR